MIGITGRTFGAFSELCGERSTLKNVVLATNMWGMTSCQVGEAREKELPRNIFKLALGKQAQMVRYQNTAQSAHDIIRMIMKNHPVTLPIRGEPPQDSIELTARMKEMERRAKKEREPAEVESVDPSRRLQEATKASVADRTRLEQEVKEGARAEADYQQQLADPTRLPHGDLETSASVAHRVNFKREIKLQDRIQTVVTNPTHVPPRKVPCVQVLSAWSLTIVDVLFAVPHPRRRLAQMGISRPSGLRVYPTTHPSVETSF